MSAARTGKAGVASTVDDAVRQAPAEAPATAVTGGGDGDGAARRKLVGLLGGLLGFGVVLALPEPAMLTTEAHRTAAVVVLMATWWMTEAIPLPATALLPLVVFPVLGILSPEAAAAPYANPVIFLFMGGFLLALAMERWELHRRIALAVVAMVGAGPRRLVLGFMVATATLSMWVSNTATAAMMLPIGIALAQLLRPAGEDARYPFAIALMLGIAYGATIGGLGTLIGTPPNVVFAAAAQELLGREIGFLDWMLIGIPVVIVFLPIAWALLVYVLFPPGELPPGAADMLLEQRRGLGPLRRTEATVMAVFALTVAGWLLREPKLIGDIRIPGITDVIPGIHDATIAMFGALLLFVLPAGGRGGGGADGLTAGTRLMDWNTARRLPWGVLLLFGGGLSLARAFEVSGLTAAIGELVAGFAGLPGWLLLGAVCATFIALSELASNTAIAAMAMPILVAAATGMGQDPILFMAAAALASSAAFMLPVATPPNAIVFGSGYLTIGQMMRAGLWLNFVSVLVMTLAAVVLVGRVLG